MSPTRRVKPGDSKDALDEQPFITSNTGAALEDHHDEEEDDIETMREEITGNFEEDEDEDGVMQEFPFQRLRESSASNVGLFQLALDSDENDNGNENVRAVGGTTDNNSVTAGPSSLIKHCRPLASSSLETGPTGGRGCYSQGEYSESTRLVVDEVDQRRSERRRGLNFGTSLLRGVLSLHRQRGTGDESSSLIYQEVREEDEDKENEAKENQEEQNAEEEQQTMLPIEENIESENEEEIYLSVCVIVSAFRVVKLNNNDNDNSEA